MEILSRRTESDAVFANPDGTLTLEQSIVPVRVRRNGRLVPVDPALERRGDGRVAPRASTSSMSFSGGGDTVFATLRRGGRELSLSWHDKLPRPNITGSTATYPNVMPGVDLTVTAAGSSFSHALVVKNAQAARSSALSAVTFGVRTKGLQLKSRPDGGIEAVNPNGTATFTAPRPVMWDSSESAAPGTAASAGKRTTLPLAQALKGAADGARQSALGVRLTAGALTLAPDQKMLTDPGTVFPVVIDPVWDDSFENAWALAYKHTAIPGSESTVYANGGTLSDYARVGRANDTQRGGEVQANSYFRIPTAKFRGKQIVEAKLRIKQEYSGSWSCKSGEVLVRDIGATLPGGITWNNQPAWRDTVDSSHVSFGGRDCPAGSSGLVEFDVASMMGKAARLKWTSWSFALTAKSNTIDVSWRKFDPNSARVSVRFNTAPDRPTAMSTDPTVPCSGGFIGKTDQVVLRAKVRDAEDTTLTVRFDYAQVGTATKRKTVNNVGSGSIVTLPLVARDLPDGTYWWDVSVSDGSATSPWGGQCRFTIDSTRPGGRPTIASDDFPANQTTGIKPAGSAGSFTFSMPTGAGSGVTRYEWWSDQDSTIQSAPATSTGGVSQPAKFTPWAAGPQYVYARGVDAAGNTSETSSHLFYAGRRGAPDKPGDVNGDDLTDLWTVNPEGELWLSPGQGNGTFARGQRASEESFQGASITHRGSWSADDSEDLVVLRPSSEDPAEEKELWVYHNKGNGTLGSGKDDVSELTVSSAGDRHWLKAEQVLAVSSVDDDNHSGSVDAGDSSDLLVKDDGGKLWLYRGMKGEAALDTVPVLPVGNGDWTGLTLIAPGDLNGDGLPEIWARDGSTGKIHQYTSRQDPSPASDDPLLDLSVFSDPAPRSTWIGTGFKQEDYPQLSSEGDFEAKYDPAGKPLPGGYPDLWSSDTLGSTVAFPGQAPANGTSFGQPRQIVPPGTPWSTCEKFSSAATGEHSLCGPVLSKFKSLGGVTAFGYPATDVLTASDNIGRYAHFRTPKTGVNNRSIYWSPHTGAWSVHGEIWNRWSALSKDSGILGYPTSDERHTADGDDQGRFTTFSKGGKLSAIYWSPETDAHEIHGGIYTRFKAIGGTKMIGYPTSSEKATSSAGGRYQLFRKRWQSADSGSVYWTSGTGAWPVYGAIYSRWATLGDGFEKSSLGYPLSEEYAVAGGMRTDFQNGYIRWNDTTGVAEEHKSTDLTNHLRKDMAGDVNGDGHPDVITAYDYGSETSALYVSLGNGKGGYGAAAEIPTPVKGSFGANRTKWATGDFNGDGKTDVAAFYGYSNGTETAWTFLGHSNGRFYAPFKSAELTSGWDWNNTTVLAGDTNGDHRDDLIAVYDHKDGTMGLHTFTADASGGFGAPKAGWKGSGFTPSLCRWTVGDANGDGRSDLTCVYVYGAGSVNVWTFTAKADGLLNAPFKSWGAASGWDVQRLDVTAGDFDGDKRTDLAAVRYNGGGNTTIHTLKANADGGYGAPVSAWDSGPDAWFSGPGNYLTGDVDQDGLADITVTYNYTFSGASKINTFRTDPEGGFKDPLGSWFAEPGTW
ncbi:FG-GAP-like repeat-containing protein [Streptomyces sp. NPDC101118]|uniref:FG-GAP-like repeat-containing protein n=1 Tax=Streptomyces sp. NPDC101118 TaxID=3366109 RepID=UPI0037F39D15